MLGTKVIEQLFSFFAADLAEHYPEQAGSFVCPLCLQRFLDTEMLNKAHLWPKALGGHIYTLACRKCNADVGTRIEKHEIERVKYLNLDKLPFTEKVEGVEGHISLLCSIKDIDGKPTLMMEISDKHSNPSTLVENKRMFDTKEILQKKVTLSYKGKFNEKIALLTYIHFAYMSLFHLIGYQWVRTLHAAKIREQLAKPKEAIFPVVLTDLEREPAAELAQPSQPILFQVQGETVLQGYFVATPELPHNNGDRLGIWIPKLADTADNVLNMPPPNDHFSLRYLGTICRKPGQHVKC